MIFQQPAAQKLSRFFCYITFRKKIFRFSDFWNLLLFSVVDIQKFKIIFLLPLKGWRKKILSIFINFPSLMFFFKV